MIQEHPITSLAEFTDYIESKDRVLWIYRGHRIAEWPLKPSLHRARVRQLQYAFGPIVEDKLLEKFRRAGRPHLDVEPRDGWEWLALAQHHGLLTRLLDWTENPLIALFFAVEHANSSGEDSVVWAWFSGSSPRVNEVAKTTTSPFNVTEITVFDPPHVTPRITVQKAVFTCHPVPSVPPEEWKGHPEKIVIPHTHRVSIRESLERFGIVRGSLFPDLDGIAQGINRSTAVTEADEYQPADKFFDDV